ncbi:hypothetical protein ABIC65_003354 [Sphingomonas trueperi]|uniref:hypothetical protein n=1 Tax=Sphingomonas trueperi TaxID=53317 RepID=UPI00339B4CF4
MINTPPVATLFRNAAISVVGRELEIELTDREYRPRYTVVENKQFGFLVDAMTIKLDAIEAARLAPFGAFDLREVEAPYIGQEVTIHGFPGLNTELIDSTDITATVDQVVGISIGLDKPSAIGLSGGPITAAGRLIGLIHGDVGTEGNFRSGIGVFFAGQLRAALFR